MEYKTEFVRPLSYYAQITFLAFHPMEKDERYKIHSVKGQLKFRKPLFGLFKRKPTIVKQTTFKIDSRILPVDEIIDDPNWFISHRRRIIFKEDERAIYRTACVEYVLNEKIYYENFLTNEEAYNYYKSLKAKCNEAGIKFPSLNNFQ